MASIKEAQQEAMAAIDVAKAMADKVVAIMGLLNVDEINFQTNPIGLLLQMLKHLGVTYEDIRLILTKLIIYATPIMEVSVKAILLTNLKHMVSCSTDPRIPDKFRKRYKGQGGTEDSQEYGIDIDIESIDFMDKLSVNPLSDEGREMYFGLDGVEDVYKFARADDFDAFLWFVIHKSRFPKAATVGSLSSYFSAYGDNPNVEGDSLLEQVKVTFDEDNTSKGSIVLGNTFKEADKDIVSMCIDVTRNESGFTTSNTLVPVGDNWNSANWYVRRASYLAKNLGFGWSANWSDKSATTRFRSGLKPRDYSKERAICNLQYIDQASSTSPIIGLVNNKIRFTILPKPRINGLKIELYDADGTYNLNGRFTKDAQGKLVECYKGLTVYEFNYDYVMSLKLFDAKVIATALLDSLVDMRAGIRLSHQFSPATDRIKEVVKNIINTDDSELSNCYYTFDNSKYDALLKLSEERRAKRHKFGNVTSGTGVFDSVHEILSEYNSNAELHEQVDVLNRAITQAAVTITEGLPEQEAYGVEFDFVSDLIANFATVLVNSVLSPKVMMLLQVNQTLMGGTWEKFTVEDVIKQMNSLVVSLVREIKDMVVQELMRIVLEQLAPIRDLLMSLLVKEQLDGYTDIINDLMRNCPFLWFKFGNQDEDTKLDTVDYADIDVSHDKAEGPITNKC